MVFLPGLGALRTPDPCGNSSSNLGARSFSGRQPRIDPPSRISSATPHRQARAANALATANVGVEQRMQPLRTSLDVPYDQVRAPQHWHLPCLPPPCACISAAGAFNLYVVIVYPSPNRLDSICSVGFKHHSMASTQPVRPLLSHKPLCQLPAARCIKQLSGMIRRRWHIAAATWSLPVAAIQF